MRITQKVTVERDITKDIICNCCGHSCININECNPEGINELTVTGGYGSNILEDGNRFTFSICETCLGQIIVGFVVSPEFSCLDQDEDNWTKWRARATKTLNAELGNYAMNEQEYIRKKPVEIGPPEPQG